MNAVSVVLSLAAAVVAVSHATCADNSDECTRTAVLLHVVTACCRTVLIIYSFDCDANVGI
jgi:hypothetical protein